MNETKRMRLPSRIRKMSYRRQKVAMIRWYAAQIELRISSFIGSRLDDKLQATIADAIRDELISPICKEVVLTSDFKLVLPINIPVKEQS